MGPAPLELLDVVVAAWSAGLVDSRRLPGLAADLVEVGLDVPALVSLAGLDLGPFDPRDAGDLLRTACRQSDLLPPDRESALVTALAVLAWGVRNATWPLRRLPDVACHLWYRAGCPVNPPEMSELFQLSEEYDAGIYGHAPRSAEQIDQDVIVAADRLFAGHPISSWANRPAAALLLDHLLSASLLR